MRGDRRAWRRQTRASRRRPSPRSTSCRRRPSERHASVGEHDRATCGSIVASGPEQTEEIWCTGVRWRHDEACSLRSDHARIRILATSTTTSRAPAEAHRDLRHAAAHAAAGGPGHCASRCASRSLTSRSTISGRTRSRSARPACRTALCPPARRRSANRARRLLDLRDRGSKCDRSIPPAADRQHLPRAIRRRRAGQGLPRLRGHRVHVAVRAPGPRPRRRVEPAWRDDLEAATSCDFVLRNRTNSRLGGQPPQIAQQR